MDVFPTIALPENNATEDEEEFREGRILTYLHKRKERNRRAVERKKQSVLESTGHLQCEVCAFDFFWFYGELGQNFAECHHRVPIADLTEHHGNRLADLAIVCANCHRMLHRGQQLLSVEQLREIIEQRRTRNH